MTNQATVNVSLQWTPPNALVNSGNVNYPVKASYNAQNVGALDILSTESAPITNSVPFGSVAQCLILAIENSQATDIGVKINGGVQLAGITASITYSTGVNTITGLNGMTAALIGTTITIAAATTSANNGLFTILAVPSASSITVTNASGVTDANNGHIVWVLTNPLDNFKIPTGGLMTFASPGNPGTPINTPPEAYILSCSVTSYAVPVTGAEQINFYVFGN